MDIVLGAAMQSPPITLKIGDKEVRLTFSYRNAKAKEWMDWRRRAAMLGDKNRPDISTQVSVEMTELAYEVGATLATDVSCEGDFALSAADGMNLLDALKEYRPRAFEILGEHIMSSTMSREAVTLGKSEAASAPS